MIRTALLISDVKAISIPSLESLIKENGKIKGVIAHDSLNNNNFSINSDNVINATGVFSRSIMELDSNKLKTVIRPSQGVHLVVDKCFLNGNFGILVPKTSDGRVLFAVPWLDHVIIGTTDTVIDNPSFNPESTQEEINFILENIKNYLEVYPLKEDIKSVFVGLRPLVALITLSLLIEKLLLFTESCAITPLILPFSLINDSTDI